MLDFLGNAALEKTVKILNTYERISHDDNITII